MNFSLGSWPSYLSRKRREFRPNVILPKIHFGSKDLEVLTRLSGIRPISTIESHARISPAAQTDTCSLAAPESKEIGDKDRIAVIADALSAVDEEPDGKSESTR